MATNQNQQPEEAQVSKTEQFVANNTKNVLGVVAGLILLVVCVFGVRMCNANADANAAQSEAMYQAQFDFEAGNYAAALENFQSVINEFGSSKVGNLAKAYAGLCQKNLGDYASAIEYLKDYSGDDNILAPAFLSALGDCYVDSETPDYAAAAKSFEKAASLAANAQFSPLYLFKAGLAYEKNNDNAKALKAYETIKDKYADSELANSIDKYIVRVK